MRFKCLFVHTCFFLLFATLFNTIGNAAYVLPTSILDIHQFEKVKGGGYGGNPKIGMYAYGDDQTHPAFEIMRDAASGVCYLLNSDVVVRDYRDTDFPVINFPCQLPNERHNNIYWNGAVEDANEEFLHSSYPSANDALYYVSKTNEMFKKYVGVSVLTDEDGQSVPINVVIHMGGHSKYQNHHYNRDPVNANWDYPNGLLLLGKGDEDNYYPFVALSSVAHELAHGFTFSQHFHRIIQDKKAEAVLDSAPIQAIALDESFSDMAAIATEFYITGKTNWQIGSEIIRDPSKENSLSRYFDFPSRDCQYRALGDDCSIDTMKDLGKINGEKQQFFDKEVVGIDAHLLAGVFNRAFYLLSTANGWDIQKAFSVMAKANRFYWKPQTEFQEAACGVIKAVKDDRSRDLSLINEDAKTVAQVMSEVGIDTSRC